MKRLFSSVYRIMAFAMLTGCSLAPNTINVPTIAPPSATIISLFADTATATSPAISATTTVQETAEVSATATGTPAASTSASPAVAADIMLVGYQDDRSTPSGLILSFFNALNRKEYLRAYSYMESPMAKTVGTFAQFQNGYQDTASIQATLGKIGGDNGAGQIYYSVPAVLKVQTTGGQTKTYAGCYTLHLARPEIQTAPPFQPMGIASASVSLADNAADPNTLLSGACQNAGISITSVPTTDANTLGASNYLDDRSTAVEVLRSLFNAVNRKEYARAYFYWQNPSTANSLPPFAQFQQGYQNTASVDADFGIPTSDIGAGQIRFRVPATLRVKTTGGASQIFIGCYQLHLGQPAFQAAPPFQPLGIERASVQPAANDSAAAGKMASACANMQ